MARVSLWPRSLGPRGPTLVQVHRGRLPRGMGPWPGQMQTQPSIKSERSEPGVRGEASRPARWLLGPTWRAATVLGHFRESRPVYKQEVLP